jgi:hypothetical protein
MSPDQPDRPGWRREGGPTSGEFALALVLVIIVAIGAVLLLGEQTSQILHMSSGRI